jgi:hypothetical protein
MKLKGFMVALLLGLFAIAIQAQSTEVVKQSLIEKGFTVKTDCYADLKEGFFVMDQVDMHKGFTYWFIVGSDDLDVIDVGLRLTGTNIEIEDSDVSRMTGISISQEKPILMSASIMNKQSKYKDIPKRIRLMVFYKETPKKKPDPKKIWKQNVHKKNK